MRRPEDDILITALLQHFKGKGSETNKSNGGKWGNMQKGLRRRKRDVKSGIANKTRIALNCFQ